MIQPNILTRTSAESVGMFGLVFIAADTPTVHEITGGERRMVGNALTPGLVITSHDLCSMTPLQSAY